MKKNEITELDITDIGTGGEGIGKSGGYTLFVKDALPGDRVKARVLKTKKSYGFARLEEIIVPSKDRAAPPCPVSRKCGGCQIMALSYSAQLRFKEKKVREALRRIGGQEDFRFNPIIGMHSTEKARNEAKTPDTANNGFKDPPLRFRNKIQLPVGVSKDGRPVTGFYAGRTHCIIENDDCPVSPEAAAVITDAVKKYAEKEKISVYCEKTGEGLLRHLLIRTAHKTGEIMVCPVINGEGLKRAEQSLAGALLNAPLPEPWHIASVCLNINKAQTNVIMGNRSRCVWGRPYIEDELCGLKFRISPESFYQVNSSQTEKLYAKVLEYAALSGTETVWDLYCGIGTISLILAKKAKRVFGIETVPAAIKNARENARLNGISNAGFYCGKAEEVFQKQCEKEGRTASGPKAQGGAPKERDIPYQPEGSGESSGDKTPQVIVLDPPRKGCEKSLLDAIMAAAPQRIVYVSCDPATLARDVKILSEKYRLEEVTPVDMFPHTVSVETVCLLSQRKPDARQT